jgi:hypothetical protein
MEDLKHERNLAEFNRKRSLYQNHFLDADEHEAKRDDLQTEIDTVRKEIQELLAA